MLVRMTLVFVGLLSAGYASGEEVDVGKREAPAASISIADAFKQGTFKGLLRYSGQNRDSNLRVLQDSTTPEIDDQKKQQYSAIGGYLGYETAPWKNVSAGVTFYTSNKAGNNPDDRRGLGGLDEEDGGQEAYSVVGEAFIKYAVGDHLLTVGRQELPDYRFVSLSDIRMSTFTHEALIYENRSLPGLRLNFGYIQQQKDRNATEFEDMVRAARAKTGCGAVDEAGDCINTGSKKFIRGDFDSADFDSGGAYIGDDKDMSLIGGVYTHGPSSVELWDYYVEDFVNTTYLYARHRFESPNSRYNYTLALQYASQNDVGSAVAGDIDTWFYGVKAQVDGPGVSAFVSYNEVDYNEKSYDGGTIFVRWGSPQMFNSFQVQDSELAGTKSYGAGIQYDLGRAGLLPGVVMRLRYADYDLPDNISQADARQDRTEFTFDLRYSFAQTSGFGIFTKMDGLSLQLRLAYNEFETDYNYAAFQAFHGYKFESVTDDFVDARLYLDYRF
jgi:hypothetical protein